MADPTLFRGRLTGVSVADDTDPEIAGERQAIVTYVQEDTDTATYADGPIIGKAKVFLPNNVPCPLYAANLHLFGLVNGPPILPLVRDKQPKVYVRRDANNDAGDSACMSIVISPTFTAVAVTKWAETSPKPSTLTDFVKLSFVDAQAHAATGKLGYYPELYTDEQQGDIIQPGTLVSVTQRTSLVDAALPASHLASWIVAPLNAGNTCPCLIQSGSGSSYNADFYANDLITPTDTGVPVTQLQISGDTIPAGTWAMASRIAGVWYIQVPVWLA